MPFDGGSQHGAQPLLAPQHYHPDSPCTGVVLAAGLRTGYMYSRTAARLIGVQTYRRALTEAVAGGAFGSTTWVDIAEFDARIPGHATHISMVVRYYGGLGNIGDTINVHHRIVAIRSGETDTGDDLSAETEPLVGTEWPTEGLWTLLDYEASTGQAYLELATVTVPNDVVIRVQAYAVDTNGTAVGYMPLTVSCWWESIG